MKAEDLRIGNLITRESVNNICTVNWGIIKDLDLFQDNYMDYKPIPLTEEWLVKFGFHLAFFNKDSGFKVFRIDKHKKSIIVNLELGVKPLVTLNYATLTYLEHVHQFQNLYYSLTQKELTIKE